MMLRRTIFAVSTLLLALSSAACGGQLLDLSGTPGHQYCVDDPDCSQENASLNEEGSSVGSAPSSPSFEAPSLPSPPAPSFPQASPPRTGFVLVLPATGGPPVFGTSLGGGLVLPATGGPPVFGTELN
jgi:hypothetical protein